VSRSKQRRPSNFQRAADGSMTLLEHIRELRKRLLRACLAILAGAVGGYFVAPWLKAAIQAPYCDFVLARNPSATICDFNVGNPLDDFMLTLKLALFVGLVVAAPIWLYQLWAFIAPGLHKRERRFSYAFAVVATPLFAGGMTLGFVLISRSLRWFLGLSTVNLTVDLVGYFDFVTGVMLLFGVGFEFPLIVAMLNFAGLVTAKRLLGWWRIAVFLMFLFAAIVTPTPDPFNMTILALCLAVLYFAAVGVAFINDRRRARKAAYAGMADDEASPLDPVSPVDAPTWGAPNRYDDET
jgi:sec-independent protein translocase protein TatC